MFRRARTMAPAGMVLSQPTMTTRASNEWPMAATSMESVMTSRLTSEARMPSVPMETPSLTEMVLISMGVPPAARTPSLTRWAMRRWLKLQGMVSIHSCATPTMGRARSSSEKPMDLSWERAGARAGPSVMAALLRLRGSDMEGPRVMGTEAVSRYMVGAEAGGFKGWARVRPASRGRGRPTMSEVWRTLKECRAWSGFSGRG